MKILDGGGKKKAKSTVPVSVDAGVSGPPSSAAPAVVPGTTTQLIRVEDVPRWRAPKGSRKGSRKAKPVPDLRTPRGNYVWSNESVLANPERSSRTDNEPSPLAGDAVEREVPETQNGDAFPQNEDHFAASQTIYLDHSQVKSQDRVKKERQWRVWDEMIPGLVDPYLELVERTTSLRKRPDRGEPQTCACVTRKLVVMCVYFDRE